MESVDRLDWSSIVRSADEDEWDSFPVNGIVPVVE